MFSVPFQFILQSNLIISGESFLHLLMKKNIVSLLNQLFKWLVCLVRLHLTQETSSAQIPIH